VYHKILKSTPNCFPSEEIKQTTSSFPWAGYFQFIECKKFWRFWYDEKFFHIFIDQC